MRQRRETVEHPFGTMKARMGCNTLLTKTLPKVAPEMALSCSPTIDARHQHRWVKPLIAAMGAETPQRSRLRVLKAVQDA